MGIALPGIAQAEAWSSGVMLPTGWHDVAIADADEGKSSGGYDQIELRFENANGDIREWLVVNENTIGKVASLLDAVGIDRSELSGDFEPMRLKGRKLAIFVGEEPDKKNPGQTRRRVQAYDKPGSHANGVPADTSGFSSGATGKDDDIPF